MSHVRDFRTVVQDFYCNAPFADPNADSTVSALSSGHALPLGMGCAWLGGHADAARQQQMQATLDAAFAGGIRYFDTSARYGASEFRVGEFVSRIPRDRLFLASKAGIPDEYTPREAALHFRQSLHNSLQRLQTDRLDLYQVHDVSSLDNVFAPDGVLDVLLDARRDGLIRYFGIGVRDHALLRQCAAHPEWDSILTYLDYTLLDQSAAELIAFAAAQNVGVIQGSPLAFGLLTGSDPRTNPSIGPDRRDAQAQAGRLYDFACQHNVSLLALALQFPLRNPHLSLILTGPSTPAEMQRSLQAARQPIASEVWDALHNQFHSVM